MDPKNPPSLEELLCRHIQDVYRYLWFACGDRHLAQDMTQETLCRALAGREGFAGKSAVKTWLFAIARNVHASTVRRRERRVHRHRDEPGLQEARLWVPGCPESPEEAAIGAEERLLLRRALAELPEKHRTLLFLREYGEMPYSQIAEVMGVSLASVKKNLHLAREQLRRAYHSQEESGGCAHEVRRGQYGQP